MSTGFMLLFMLGGFAALIGLLIVFAIQQHRRNEPLRAAHIALIPYQVLQRRATIFTIAAGIGLIGYGLLKTAVHAIRVAMSGVSGFGNVRGLVSGNNSSDWMFIVCTFLLAATLLFLGVLVLRRIIVGLWLAAASISFDLLISLMIGLALYGDGRVKGGLFLFLVSISIPALVGILVCLAIQQHLLAGQKRRMDDAAAGKLPPL